MHVTSRVCSQSALDTKPRIRHALDLLNDMDTYIEDAIREIEEAAMTQSYSDYDYSDSDDITNITYDTMWPGWE